jgi:hypothetical protein
VTREQRKRGNDVGSSQARWSFYGACRFSKVSLTNFVVLLLLFSIVAV